MRIAMTEGSAPRIWSSYEDVYYRRISNEVRWYLLPTSPSLLLGLLPFQSLLLRPLSLHGRHDLVHPIRIGLVLVLLFLMLLRRKEASILTQLPDSALPFLLVLRAEFRCFVPLMVGITIAEVVGGGLLELRDIAGNGYGLVRLEPEGLAGLRRKLE